MKKSKLLITSLCTLSPLILSTVVYLFTPQDICIHFTNDWKCDNLVNKNFGLFVAPLLLLILNFVLNRISESDPKYSISPYRQVCQWLAPIMSWIVTLIVVWFAIFN